jgi:transcription-repair coupling factor (superfamily II helicase)
MTGVRELSLITTPPVDRLAVRTFISPFDPVIIRETLLRELIAAGRASMSARASPISRRWRVPAFEHVPELKVAIAHGQMAPASSMTS